MTEMIWRNPTTCSSCVLFRASSCFVWSSPIAGEIDRIKRIQRLDPDKNLIGPGEASCLMGIVVAGVLRSTHVTAEGRQEVVSLHGRGSVFGHPFMAASRYGLETASPVVLCCFDRHDFERLAGEDPHLGRAFLLQVVRELAGAREHARMMGSPRIFERIARFVLAQCDCSSQAPITVRLPVSRRDMAGFLATTPETISRAIQAMARGKIVRVRDARTLVVVDLAGLERVAGQSLAETLAGQPSLPKSTFLHNIDHHQCRDPYDRLDGACRARSTSHDPSRAAVTLRG